MKYFAVVLFSIFAVALHASPKILIESKPYPIEIKLKSTAFIFIDFQNDFLKEGGFASSLGNNVSHAAKSVAPARALLEAARRNKMNILHTREGHRSDLSDLSQHKFERGNLPAHLRIGAQGPMGRILIRGEKGHALIDEMQALEGEPIIDKPGKGAFYATDLEHILLTQKIDTLIICGVTTQVCVETTVREANDRGFNVIVPEDCVGSYHPDMHDNTLREIASQGGIFGSVTNSANIIEALNSAP